MHLSFNLLGPLPNKRFYVTEIVLQLELANVTFRAERNDNRKYVSVRRLVSSAYLFIQRTQCYRTKYCTCKMFFILYLLEQIIVQKITQNLNDNMYILLYFCSDFKRHVNTMNDTYEYFFLPIIRKIPTFKRLYEGTIDCASLCKLNYCMSQIRH